MPVRIRGHVEYPKQPARQVPALTRPVTAKPRRTWTAEQDELVRSIYPTKGPAALAERLGRSKEAITMRAISLGVRVEGRAVWTEDHDNMLRMMWRKLAPTELASRVGVSLGCLYNRARSLGLPLLTTRPRKAPDMHVASR